MANDQTGPLPGQAIIRQLKPDYVRPAKTSSGPEWAQKIPQPQSGPAVGVPPMPGDTVRSPGND